MRRTRVRSRNRKAFTLIELLVALAIISILAALTLPRFMSARYRAYLSSCMLNERNIATAMESYRADSHEYPPDLQRLVTANYINNLPTCPSAPGTVYQYEITSTGDSYTVSCPGYHEYQLPDIPDGFPQYNASSGLHDKP